MNIYNRSTLVSFYGKHAQCREVLEKWYHDVLSKNWKKPGDVTADFNTARTIGQYRVIFKISGNEFRLIAEINYEKGWLFIKFIGTHAEYDKIDPETVDLYRRRSKLKKKKDGTEKN